MNWSNLFATRTKQMRRSAVRELLKLTAQPEIISFAGGLPAAELFPVERFREAAQAVLNRSASRSLQYGETEGVPELRAWIAEQFCRTRRNVLPENVAIVSGGQQALDLIGRILLESGDRVIVENPTYLALLSAWRPHGVVFTPVPSDADGMCVHALEPLLRERTKLLYATPNFQNPQGTTLSLERRHQLASLLRQEGVAMVEDDPYGELRYSGESLPHVFHIDARSATDERLQSNVIYVGTFSKVLVPGLRVGWVIAEGEVIDRIVRAKQAADLHTSTLSQFLALEMIRDGFLEAHIARLREVYRERRDAMIDALGRFFPSEAAWTRPQGGMFLMVTLPATVNAEELLRRSIEQRVAFVPGREFHLDGMGTNTLRLNFSNAAPDQIIEGIKRLGAAVKQLLRGD